MKKAWIKQGVTGLAAAALITAAGAFGVLFSAEQATADALYFSPRAHDGIISVVGIDQKALEEIGPFPWGRDVMAAVVEKLNSNPDARPAVIGLDVLYCGDTEPERDRALAQAALEGGNVVVAEAAGFSSELVTAGDKFYIDRFAITGYDKVYEALGAASVQGHINAMQDRDGILRHGLLYVEPGQRRVYSFGWNIYEKYCADQGIPLGEKPRVDGNGFFTIPYSVSPGDFSDGISVADIYFDRVSGDFFADRIVLIGPYAAGLQDQYMTSIDHGAPMYGIDIQANVIQALLDGRYLREGARGWMLAALFVITCGSVWFLWDRKLKWSILWWLGFSGGWVLMCLAFSYGGILVSPFWVPVAVTIVFIASVAINYIRAALEKKKVTDTFKRYVDPSVMNELLREGTDSLGLGGKMTDIAVLFVDIRGFTTMSEVLSPPEIVEILNRYLSLTTKCVMDNHGTLDKFVGDCTMAIWNAPLKQEDYVMNACKAALAMVEGSKALEEELRKTYGRTVSFGVGVHCGKAVVGNIGAQMRMDFTAIGDTVNTAARLEANAPGGCIYISRAVADHLGDRIKTTSLGTAIKLKGKADGFEILTLDGLQSK